MANQNDLTVAQLEQDLGTAMTVEEVEQRLEMLSIDEIWCCDGDNPDGCCGCECS